MNKFKTYNKNFSIQVEKESYDSILVVIKDKSEDKVLFYLDRKDLSELIDNLSKILGNGK